MPFTTKRQALSLAADEKLLLESLRRSRSGEKREVLHAGILLDLASGMSDGAAARSNGVNRHTVALCARKVRRIPDDAIAWVQHCACRKPKELGYSYELWTYSLLQEHVRKHCLVAGHPSLAELSRSRLHRILTQGEIRPHRIRYYVERRDPEFEARMAVVLHVYKEVEIVNEELVKGTLKEPPVVTISYDEKPGIQALATTTPDLPPVTRKFRSHLRDYEYKRLGTVSLLAGLDLHTGRVTEIVSDHHASEDFIALLGKLDDGYPPQNADSPPAGQPLGAHFQRDTRLAQSSPEPIRVR